MDFWIFVNPLKSVSALKIWRRLKTHIAVRNEKQERMILRMYVSIVPFSKYQHQTTVSH